MSRNPARPYLHLKPLDAVLNERLFQHGTWGDRNRELRLSFADWALILGCEVGEAMEALGRVHWPHDRDPDVADADKLLELRSELIQVAAVAVAIIEAVDQTELVDLRGVRP